jgi:hypothetical protein
MRASCADSSLRSVPKLFTFFEGVVHMREALLAALLPVLAAGPGVGIALVLLWLSSLVGTAASVCGARPGACELPSSPQSSLAVAAACGCEDVAAGSAARPAEDLSCADSVACESTTPVPIGTATSAAPHSVCAWRTARMCVAACACSVDGKDGATEPVGVWCWLVAAGKAGKSEWLSKEGSNVIGGGTDEPLGSEMAWQATTAADLVSTGTCVAVACGSASKAGAGPRGRGAGVKGSCSGFGVEIVVATVVTEASHCSASRAAISAARAARVASARWMGAA